MARTAQLLTHSFLIHPSPPPSHIPHPPSKSHPPHHVLLPAGHLHCVDHPPPMPPPPHPSPSHHVLLPAGHLHCVDHPRVHQDALQLHAHVALARGLARDTRSERLQGPEESVGGKCGWWLVGWGPEGARGLWCSAVSRAPREACAGGLGNASQDDSG